MKNKMKIQNSRMEINSCCFLLLLTELRVDHWVHKLTICQINLVSVCCDQEPSYTDDSWYNVGWKTTISGRDFAMGHWKILSVKMIQGALHLYTIHEFRVVHFF